MILLIDSKMHERTDYLRKLLVMKFVWLKLSLETRLSISGFCLTALEKKKERLVHIMESLGLRQSNQAGFTVGSRYDTRIHTYRLFLYTSQSCTAIVWPANIMWNGVTDGMKNELHSVCNISVKK